jgi:hypothetical protein
MFPRSRRSRWAASPNSGRIISAPTPIRARALHYLGTGLAMLFILAFLVTGDWLWLIGAPIAGYAFAWVGHFHFEHNRPATFDHPLWSLRGDFTMLCLWAAGRLDGEIERAKLPH